MQTLVYLFTFYRDQVEKDADDGSEDNSQVLRVDQVVETDRETAASARFDMARSEP
jgi:hypothetical protein